MKKLLSLVLTAVLVLIPFASIVNAEAISLKNASDTIIDSFISSFDDVSIEYATPLFDGNDQLNGYWYHIKDADSDGYVIAFNWKGELKITEMSFDADLPLDPSLKTYYNGLTDYYQRSGTVVKSARSNRPITKLDSLYKAPELDLSSSLQRHPQSNIVTRSVSLARLDHDMTLINQREVGSEDADSLCTQTSAAMIFQYYDEYRDGYGAIASNRGEDLVLDVLEYMNLDSNGVTSIGTATEGIEDYASSHGFSANIEVRLCDENNYTMTDNFINLISNDIYYERPAMVIIGSNAYGAGYDDYYYLGYSTLHAMAVTGTWSSYDSEYLSVADPWGGVRRSLLWDIDPYAGGYPSAVYAAFRISIAK